MGDALSFLRAYTFLALLVFISLFFLSRFLLFTLLYWWFFLLVQVKQIGVVLQSFYYNRGGRGGFVQGVGGEGIVNYGEINNKSEANELTTLLQG